MKRRFTFLGGSPVRTPLLLAFFALLALIGGSLVLTNRSISDMLSVQEQLTGSEAVRLELEFLLRAYVDAETGQRGFLVTGDEKFLEPYKTTLERLGNINSRLESLLKGDAGLSAVLEKLQAAGKRRLELLDARIAERRAGDIAAATSAEKLGEGKAAMDEIRRYADIIEKSKAQDVVRIANLNRQSRGMIAVWTTGAALIVAAALVALFFFTRKNLLELSLARDSMNKLLAAERAAHSQAARANKLKDEFLALVSHELRTPLNAMLGWTSLLSEGAADENELKEGLEAIDRNARAQARLVDDLLDVSRIISGKVRLVVAEVNLRAVVASVIESLKPAAQAREVKVQLLATTEPAEVLGDADRLQQVVWNLLSNAIKFTSRGGGVILSLEHSQSHVVFEVTDTGAGIPGEFLPHIFNRFSQGDVSTTRAHGGLGLGLAITRHLVELHGGTVTARSPGEGKGSTFRVEIPVVAVKELRTQLAERIEALAGTKPEPSPTPRLRLDGRRVLAVDDQPDTLAVINRLLSRAGAEVRTATSAADGLSVMNEWRPDLLISDVGMPGQDGHDFIREVRTRIPQSTKRLPAVALTAFAREADRKAAIDAGFDEHLAKPIDAGMLVSKVAELLGIT